MKLKLPLLILLAATFTACAGGDKRSDQSGNQDLSDEFDDERGEKGDRSTPKLSPVASDARPSRTDKKYQPLSDALRNGQMNLVTQEAAKILGQNSNDPVALNAVAMSLHKQGRLGAAKFLLEKALEKNPNNPSILNNIAMIQVAEGDVNSGLLTLKQAYRANDRNPEVAGNLGSLYVQGGDYAKALPLLETAYRGNKVSAAVANNYAIALRAAGQYDKAAKIYDQLVKQNSRDVNAHLNYAILLIDYMNKPKEGLALATKVKFLESDRKEVLDRANALEKKARSEIK